MSVQRKEILMAKRSSNLNRRAMKAGYIEKKKGESVLDILVDKQNRDHLIEGLNKFLAFGMGASKHAKGKIKPKDFDKKDKKRRKMAKESKRINRKCNK